jgi:nicotinate phosphoribosyltransferase
MIIESMLDDDLYKFSMGQAVFHQYPNAIGAYEFKCRNEGVKLGFLKDQVIAEIKNLESLELTPAEYGFMWELGYFKEDYLNFLSDFRYDARHCDVTVTDDGDLNIRIHGKWLNTILFEVKVLAIVNELYFDHILKGYNDEWRKIGDFKLDAKIQMLKEYPRLTLAEFGTRRRRSAEWQMYVATRLHNECPQMVGTSNVYLAMKLGIKPVGTQAHEWFQSHLGLVDNIEQAQKRALHVWLQEYDNELGTALTDTFTTPAFFRDFGNVLANEFSGCRHDSGDPIEFGYKVIEHYKKLGIDPRTKIIIFSDGLDIPEVIRIYKEFTGLIGISFGVGTNLTNDVGVTPLNIVIKLLELNGTPLVKLSDNPGKTMGDAEMVEKVKKAYGVK